MPLTAKQAAFTTAYFDPGSESYNKGMESAKTANYDGSKEILRVIASQNLTKLNIIKKGKQIQAKLAKKLDLSRAGQHKALEQAKTLAIQQKQPSALVSAIREQNEMLGYHRDKAPNQEQARAIAKRMTAQDRLIAEEVARIITDRAATRHVESRVIE